MVRPWDSIRRPPTPKADAPQTEQLETQELDVNIFSVLVYPLRSKGKDGHSVAAQIVSGWITPLLFRLQSRAYTIWINNCMLYPPPYIRSLPHSRFYCHYVFSVKSDFSRVMRARPSLLICSLLLRKYHSKCIVSSDWSRWLEHSVIMYWPIRWYYTFAVILAQKRRTKQQRWPCTHHTAKIRFHRKNKMTIKPWMWQTSDIGRRIEHAIVYSNGIRMRL